MMRSILENPKLNRKTSLEGTIKDGVITPQWRRRLTKFYRSIIPSHVTSEQQIWLYTTQDILDFSERLKDLDYDLSTIDYVLIVDPVTDIYDIIEFFSQLRNKLPDHAKVVYSNFNCLWAPLFELAASLGFSRQRGIGNFYFDSDLDCFLEMSGWEHVKKIRRFMLPREIPILSSIFDNFLVRLPVLRNLSLNSIFIARKSAEGSPRDYSTTVLVPCKNEENNIEAVIRRMPSFGQSVEILFINDKSTDSTEEKILYFQQRFPDKNVVLVQGLGKGKGEAVREGMKFATGDICMILDADLTVIPEDLPQFYEAMRRRRADFIHGTRLVYPGEAGAMRFANIVGNWGFSILFTYVLDERTTDTLCGTKVYWRRDWPLFEEMKANLKHSDVWGDYNLIFGASRYGLKMAQLPVRYFERLEGTTKMTKRIRNGLIMLRVVWQALWSVKFIS
ncbi:MAG: glycosyltransferase family 2 protein [Oculatellaceae cyanobacterium bins.114]|nr:glycosyltransferase family 2 protein [Oculatellaceae cyanobacterium bins.114]